MEELKRKGWVNYFFVETLFKHYLDFGISMEINSSWITKTMLFNISVQKCLMRR